MREELKEAISLLQKEDAASVQRALQLMQDTVYSFSMKVCGHREDAEDTMQDVLVSSLPHLAKINSPQALSVWLYTAAKNRCWRSRKKLSYRKSVALEDLMPNEAELSALLASNGATPEQSALQRQDQQLVHQAVLKLPPQYRIVLVLHDMEELETELVAKVLSLKPGTVRVRLHRARLLVRKEMDKLLSRAAQEASARGKAKGKRPKECTELFGNLSEYLDGRLKPKTCDQMEAHIAACPECIAFIGDLKRAIDRCRKLDIPLNSEVCAALRRQLAEEYLRLIAS